MKTPDKSNFAGCLVGQCLGDALGMPAEGFGPDECHDYAHGIARNWLLGSDADIDKFQGQYTDDSQLARELMQSYRATGGFDPADYARRIGAIFDENRIVGRGVACNEAAFRVVNGISWEKSGCPPPRAGNGTAMRAAPVGLMAWDDRETLSKISRDQTWITHQDPRCIAGSVAIAGATTLAMTLDNIDCEDFSHRLTDYVRPFDESFADLLLNLPAWVVQSPEAVAEPIGGAGQPEGARRDWPGISPFVVPSVLWSLYSFLKYPDDYGSAVITSIAVGGDVDTTGAMTGAIAGARAGLEALPGHLTERLHDRQTWREAELVELAYDCFEIATTVRA